MTSIEQQMLKDVYHTLVKKPIEKGETVKIGKNQLFKDQREKNYPYIVEKYEFTDDGTDMFSVHDGYSNLVDAVNVALRL